MKKLFVLLLALMVAGVFAFAQDAAPAVKFSGYLNTGLAYSKVGSNDDVVKQNGDDSATAGRMNLNGSYTNGDYGFNFRFRMQPVGGFANNNDANIVFLRRAWGWTKLAGGMVKVQAGRLGDYTWSGANGNYWNSFGNFDGPVGMQVQVMPMDGLNCGIFVPVSRGTSGATLSNGNPNPSPNATAPLTLSDTFQSSSIGVNYTMKGTVNLQAGYTMSPESKMASMWFGGQVLALPGITLDFEGQLSKLGNTTAGSKFVFEKVAYAMGPLTVSAQLSQELFNDTDIDTQISVCPQVDYALSDVANVGVNLNYGMGEKSGYYIGVYGKLTTNKSSFIKVGAGMNGGDVAPSGVVFYTPGKYAAISDNITSAFIDFVWNF